MIKTEETLKELFDASIQARIVTDWETGSSKGFGFVDFSSEEDAKAAKEAMEDGEIDGNKVTLDWAKPKGEGGFGGRGGGRGGFGGRGGGRGGRGGFGGRGRGGFGGKKRGGPPCCVHGMLFKWPCTSQPVNPCFRIRPQVLTHPAGEG